MRMDISSKNSTGKLPFFSGPWELFSLLSCPDDLNLMV